MLLRLLHYEVFHFVRIEYQIELLKRLQALLNRHSAHTRLRSVLLWKARRVLWLDFPPTPDRCLIIVIRVD